MAFKRDKKIDSAIARDKRVMLTTTRENYPFVAARGDGDFAYDVAGNKFIDFSSFIAVYTIGTNGIKQTRDAAKKQIDILAHEAFTDYYSLKPVEFAEKLVDMLPNGFGRVFFSNSGTEANEAALKFARIFTNRQYNIAFYGAFHGRTHGSLALTASKNIQRKGFSPFAPAIHVPYAYCYRCPFGKEYPSCGLACVDYIKNYPLKMEVDPKEVSAIVMEPIQGEGGYIVPPKEFVKEIRNIADDNGMLLISDEVQSGYMRTGKFVAMDHFGVKADIYTMAKALGVGFPIGATITRTSLGNIPAGSHANTFGGNLVSVAAANASIEYVKKNQAKLESGVKVRNKLIMKRLNSMLEKYDIIGDVRGIGLMIGVEIVTDKKSKEYGVKEREKILECCFEKGLLLLPAGQSTIRIIPNINMSIKNIESGLDIFEEAVKHASTSKKR